MSFRKLVSVVWPDDCESVQQQQTTTIPLFALYLITYIKKRKKKVYIYMYLIRPGAEIILRFSSQFVFKRDDHS